jgi:hypothetical protein
MAPGLNFLFVSAVRGNENASRALTANAKR